MAIEQGKVYAYPTRARCPRCQSVDTESYSRDRGKQYRKCRRPTCRHRFTVAGRQI